MSPTTSSESSNESGSDGGDPTDNLASQIVRNLKKSVFDGPDFLPEGCIETLLTEASVREALGTINDAKEGRKLLSFILQEARIIFAILLVSNFNSKAICKAVKQFRRKHLGDSSLPFTDQSQVPFFEPGGEKSWNNNSIRTFLQQQWMFLAPVFSREKLNLQLQPDHILPFTCQHSDIKSGAFGDVYHITVHEKHHINPVFTFDGRRSTVAVKEIKHIYTDDEQKKRELDNEWKREVKAHIDINEFHHPNIIEFIAAVTRKKRYLMFRWADGGNLREFWQANKKVQLTTSLVRDIVTQLLGLADALNQLHNYGGGSYRHGDLKPENILRVRTKNVDKFEIDIGVFKIADMGLAKHHTVATEFRPPTTMRYTTCRYEPPEVVTSQSANSGRSKRQDIWSFGCITLEFIVWILYGNDVLEDFNTEWVVGDRIISGQKEQSPYFEIEGRGHNRVAKIHPAVNVTMDALARDRECKGSEDTAMKDLLRIVRGKLLVINLGASTTLGIGGSLSPPSKVPIPAGSRASASDLWLALETIIKKGNRNESYWYTGKGRSDIPRLQINQSTGSNTLVVPEAKPGTGKGIPPHSRQPNTMSAPSQDISFTVPSVRTVTQARKVRMSVLKRNHGTDRISCLGRSKCTTSRERFWRRVFQLIQMIIDKTEFPVDNKFANALVQAVGTDGLFPRSTNPTLLCQKCQKLDVFEPHFHVIDTWAELEERRDFCEFCEMRFEVSQHLRARNASSLRFDRVESMLKLNESRLPVMSICRSSELRSTNNHFIQIGLPKLPKVGSRTYFDILRHFVKTCDANHPECLPLKGSRLPTRLMDVGTAEIPYICIRETEPGESLSYIALSHPWGPSSMENPHFCTYPNNVADYRKNISFDELPATFQHAVITTRELGLRYLWIDSICIIQGPKGDFAQEATRMEDVFSSAYCVLAASSARRQNDGFLNPRKEDRFLTLGKAGQDVYVGKFKDDFNAHVLEGPLSKRGWVLQERALAHRTIFFTDTQTYWECGGGVRCETLTKMENQLISFLGDPNFPSKISSDNSDRGEKIRLYENLYRQYSRLEFTRWYDRPIAIAGLEKRLIRDLNAQGGFSVFDDGRSLLQRSLLWRRGQEVSTLVPIVFPTDYPIPVPSWSWMRYEGAIDYLDAPLGEVQWELPQDRICGPWTVGEVNSWHTGDGKEIVALRATVRNFKLGENSGEDFSLFFDMEGPSGMENRGMKCVVVGRMWMKAGFPVDETTHYVLLVAAQKTDSHVDEHIYERIGVGYMAGKFIDWAVSAFVSIQ